MTQHMVASSGEHKLVGLVRNARGEPQFNDYNVISEIFYPSLTEEDWIYINERREEDGINTRSSN